MIIVKELPIHVFNEVTGRVGKKLGCRIPGRIVAETITVLRKRDGLSDIGPADSGKSKPDYPMSPRFDTDDPFDEFSPLATGRKRSFGYFHSNSHQQRKQSGCN